MPQVTRYDYNINNNKPKPKAKHIIRDALAAVDLRGYPKTSGSDGVHVLVPLARRYGYDQTRAVVLAISRALAICAAKTAGSVV